MSIKGSCHCGKTAFELTEAPTSVTYCTCSYCSKTGGLWAYCGLDGFRLTTPADDRALYRWGSKSVEHYFCDTCGCTTYGVSPVFVDYKPHPTKKKIGVNARLLDGFDPEAIKIETIDGKNLW